MILFDYLLCINIHEINCYISASLELYLNRAEQQRAASRRYRKKKRQLIDQLTSRLDELNNEKERIEKEKRDALDVVAKLKR